MKNRDYSLVETKIKCIKSGEVENNFTEEEFNIMNKVLERARLLDRVSAFVHNVTAISMFIGACISVEALVKYVIIPKMNFEESDIKFVIITIIVALLTWFLESFDIWLQDGEDEDDEDEDDE